jgi:hypothetical protein
MAESEVDSESGQSDDKSEDGDKRQPSPGGKAASKQRRHANGQARGDERRQFLNEGMLQGVLDEDEESAAEALRHLNDRTSHEELLAKELRDYCSCFFKRKDVKAIFKKKDEYGNAIIKHQSYVKEFFVWNFWSTGADASDDDDECTDRLKTYLEVLVEKGRDARGKKMDIVAAKEFSFLATAEHLEDFLREYFIKYRQRSE